MREYVIHYKADLVHAETANEAIKKGMKIPKEFSGLDEGEVVPEDDQQ